MTDLDKLIEAINGEAEAHVVQIFAKRISSSARDRGDYWPSHDVEKAFNGSLDAALELHNALLPDWVAKPVIGGAGAGVTKWHCEVENWDSGEEYSGDNHPCPARAWLLAILRAYRSQVTQ